MFRLFVLCLTVSQTFGVRSKNFETRDQTVKNTSMFMATAGITQGIVDQLGLHIDPKTWMGQLQQNVIQGTVKGTFDLAQGEGADKALKTAVVHTVVNTVAGKLVSDVGVKRQEKA